VGQILRAGWHLLELINEVLDLAKVESGKIDLSIENVDPLEVLRECVDLIGGVAAGSGIQVTLDIASDRVHMVRADPTRLKQALLNLISNAIKYNRENGLVTISARYTSDEKLRLCVTDTGVGLSEQQLQRLFQPFNRLGAERSGIEGTGIGLVITRQLVELMGGSIGVESEPGQGSTFWIELGAVDERAGLSESSVSETPELHGIAMRTVLYVEDNPANLRLVAQVLGRLPNIKLLSAHTGELGLDLARSSSPDLIILDINLPGMDGFEIRARLRLHEQTKHIPVIALSANAMPRDIERGLEAGFARYLTKPLKVAEFMKVLNELMPENAG
jgi:CheY-like chemotaxis protein/two-component sensor histidine kinase